MVAKGYGKTNRNFCSQKKGYQPIKINNMSTALC